MFTTLSTALSALNANSTAVSVVGNDLANLNTTGYKTTQIAFQDLMAESMGGINGYQLGMGTARPQTIRQFNQGGLQTGLGGLNAAIQGQGFFMVKSDKGVPLYTRDGSFTVGTNGYLVNANGLRVQGWTAGTSGVLDTNAATGDIPIPSGTLFPPVASTNVTFSLNLNSAAVAGTTTGPTSGVFSQPIKVYDSLGTSHMLTATFTKNPSTAAVQASAITATAVANGESATFTVETATGQHTVTITGKAGDTLTSQMTDLNTQMQAYGITASLSAAGNLQFTSSKAFSVSGVSSGAANLVDTTAETTNNSGLNNLTFTPTGVGDVKIAVGTKTVTANIAGGATPTQTDVDAINTALRAQGITDVSAVLDEKNANSIQIQGTATFTVTDDTADGATFVSTGTVNAMPVVTTQSNSWDYAVTMPGTDLTSGVTTTVASGTLTFDPKTGLLLSPSSADGTITLTTGSGKNDAAGPLLDGAIMNDITWSLYDASKNPLVTQVDQASAVSANTADGSAAAQLTQVLMGDSGQLLAQFSNGKSVAIAQLSISNIPNPNSMLAVGNNNFEASSQTAAPIIGTAGTGGRGNVVGGALEQSTVDIAMEFSNLITLQNAYQANSRVVTTENQILQQTVSLVQP
jgi:flagellar hook protein FlgE